ncbi:MAG: M48 family metallopeptidase [Chloroflexi bacterium]|nr:M48 family metallopeptidase [Chloroflexota bacterium]
MIEISIDPARQQQAKEYARIRRRLFVVELGLAAALTLAWLFSGASAALGRQIAAITANEWLAVALYMLVFGAVYLVVDLPLTCYSGFVLPHRYGLSTQSFGGFIADGIKGMAVGGVLGLAVIEVIYALLRTAPDTWWLWTAGFMLLFSVVLSNLAPVLILPLFYKLTPIEDTELVRRLTALAERAQARVRGVYTINFSSKTTAANAALMGLGNTRRIVLGDTLYGQFSADEIETILAHELGHHVHRDIPLGIALEAVATLAGLYLADLGLLAGVQAFGFGSIADVAAFPVFAAVMGASGFATMPLSNAFSRWRERRADQYALEATNKPDAFIGAMTRLANQNLAEVDPEPWVEWLLYSHPAIGKRLAQGEAYKRAVTNSQ